MPTPAHRHTLVAPTRQVLAVWDCHKRHGASTAFPFHSTNARATRFEEAAPLHVSEGGAWREAGWPAAVVMLFVAGLGITVASYAGLMQTLSVEAVEPHQTGA